MTTPTEIYNWYKRYKVLAADMTELQSQVLNVPAGLMEGIFAGSILSGLEAATTGGMSVQVNSGIAVGPTGYFHVLDSITTVNLTAPTGSNPARSLIVARPSLTNSDYITNPTNPFDTVPLRTTLGSAITLLPGTAASSPSYPGTESNDVVICGVRTYPGQTSITVADIDLTVRDNVAKNSSGLQNAAQFDDRLRPYRLTNQILGVRPSQLSGSNQKQFKASSNNRAAIFPKTPAGAFNANDTFLNFQTGAISGGDGATGSFTPSIPSAGNCIVATVVLTTNNTLSVVYGTAGTRTECITGIFNQTASGAGSVSIPTTGQPIAFVVVSSSNGTTVTEIDFFDARGILQGGGGSGGSNGFINFLTNGDFETSVNGVIPDNWATYSESETVTFTNATNLWTTNAASAPAAGDTVSILSKTGASGLTTATTYWVINPSGNTFQCSTTATGTLPVAVGSDGTGTVVRAKPRAGSGSGASVTFLATSTNPLDGLISTVFAKDAANRMGQGVRRDFTIPLGWRQARITGILSLINANVSNYTAGDLTIWIVDVDTGAVIQPNVSPIPKADGAWNISFLSTNSTNFRLCIHVSSVNTSAYSVGFDDFVVTPNPVLGQSVAISEWQSYTPILTNGGSTSANTGRWRRVGNVMEIVTYQAFTSAGSAATFSIAIPSGYSIDTTSLPVSQQNIAAVLGTAQFYNGSVYAILQTSYTTNTSPNGIVFYAQGASGLFQGNALANNYVWGMRVFVPIAEWSGSGTVNLGPGAQVQYIADDGSSDVWGPNGALVPNVAFSTGTTNRDIAIIPQAVGQQIRLEFNFRGNGWAPASDIFPFSTGNNGTGNNSYGIQGFWQSTTNFRVAFGNQGTAVNASNVSNGASSWASEFSGGSRYRLVIANPSAPVGFGLATNSAAGLISAEASLGEGDLGTVTIGTGTWAGLATKKYKWVRNGKNVTFWYRLEGTAASGLVEFSFDLPSDCPALATFSTAGNTEWQGFSGSAASSVSLGGAITSGSSNLYKNASGTTQIYHTQTSSNSVIAWGCISYQTA